ncbi:glycosyltransferase family 2 protein [Campylobacter hepaticus]|uniref:Capsular biosynthesis protein n=1 Tax=Campylobacter hepaticus TaxID=1813019 RepID=A0A6A7JU81_9BACT|nr:glycosyltransferase family 2 protein [Campylobacter hepaticus]AXP09030.1 capsular biosynthesis protein [Campylobacter hepaticus]MCZ0771928.1 glycosyltransferase family 2 protein [Campylobacter hepaticus]MCZ0773397.1 glycosyltransferase family 2 protein [Campylobacter hepaticus]MCZ0774648.1 glycosyltransferase family 2 protein [Campylobacter hepaticus]MDX2323993.1 glycosyltransferase family 2 protein [Campylobacter hepaticus]
MIIIFPMAGLSSRFTKAGYDKPKYMLDLRGYSVFYHVVNSFKRYFNEFEFLFIYRDIQDTKNFIQKECKKLGLLSYQSVKLDKETLGQAHTVMLGLKKANISDNESILIFNIDTFRPNFSLPTILDLSKIDGYLEVFEAEGDQWSFVLTDENDRVIKTTEKERISSLCSSGLYYFKSVLEFKQTFDIMRDKNDLSKNEFYIAPMYNYLIKKGLLIKYHIISLDEIVFCGTPDEYENLIQKRG